jgi:hypothetical protein|tara:strand:+ start:101018 stop:101326 length:309 start_codon:yes stop_codon:yes gene_type:complete
MKNLGTILFCLAYFVGCSTATVKELRLSNGNKGFDLKCLGSEMKCEERARILCDGKYRVHNFFEDDPLSYSLEKGLTMRLECLEETAQVYKECSQPGVSCRL